MSESEETDGESGGFLASVGQTVVPDAIRRRYALKFGLVLFLVALVIFAMGFVATERISAEIEEDIETQFGNGANQEASIIEEWVQRNKLTVKLITQDRTWANSERRELRLELERQQANIGGSVTGLHLIDETDGTPEVAASTSLSAGQELEGTDRGWIANDFTRFQELSNDGVLVQTTYTADGESVVGFASPTDAKDGRYLLMEVSVEDVASSLRGGERASGGFTQVVERETYSSASPQTDDVIIDERGQDTLTPYAQDAKALEPLVLADDLRNRDREAGVVTDMPANGDVIDESYVVGYAPVDGVAWVVVTQAPRSTVFGDVQQVTTVGLLATLGAVLLVFVVGLTLGQNTARSIDRLTEKTEEMREGNMNVSFETHRIDSIGRLYDAFAEMREALQAQIEEAEQARKESEVSRAEAQGMNQYLQQKAKEYSQRMQQCSNGDLTQRMDVDRENESMDQIASDFNDMVEELEKTIGQLKSYIDEVERAGAKVEQSADTLRDASEEVANSIEAIAVDTEKQKDRLQGLAQSMHSVTDELETLADNEGVDLDQELTKLRDAAIEIEELEELSEQTRGETDTVSAASAEQAAELSEVSERAHDLQRYAQPLRDILERFETEAEHEFVFSVGPTGEQAPISSTGDEETD